jgi:hypothetical protein
MKTFKQQVKQNLLAIISLVVATTALSYNTWRNEESEYNRTIRSSGFEVLIHLGKLQQISYLAHYDKDNIEGNPRRGWIEVLLINDLASLLPKPVPQQTDRLLEVWGDNWRELGNEKASIEVIDEQMDQVRQGVLAALHSLD